MQPGYELAGRSSRALVAESLAVRGQPAAPIRVLVVDDHGIVRDGLSALLSGHHRMQVVGTAADGKAAVLAATRLTPDVVVMDLALPELSGIDATARILATHPLIRIVVLSASDTSEHVFQALRAGARGYVLKESAAADIVQAVASVWKGDRYLSPRLVGILVDGLMGARVPASPVESLSPREREILLLIVAGGSSAEIGRQLSLSRKTVDTYRSRMMGKLGVNNLAGLIRFGVAVGLVPLQAPGGPRQP